MARMTTEQKIEALSTFVIPLFEKGITDLEEIAGQAFLDGATKDTGLKIQELTPLARTIGVDRGYIKTLDQRRDELREFVKADDEKLEELSTYPLFIEYCRVLTEEHDLTEKWVQDTVASIMSAKGMYVPEKSNLTAWQKATVKAFRENKNLTAKELDQIIKECGIQNYNHYTRLVHGLCHAIANTDVDIS